MLENVFQSANASFNHLKHMSLHCVPITPTTMESLLWRCPQLQSLCLRFLHLDQDSWVPAPTPLISSSVRYTYLSNLHFSTYFPGYRVLHNNTIRDGLTLGERHPEVEAVRRGDSIPPGTTVEFSPLRDLDQSMLIELDRDSVPDSGMASFRQKQRDRTRQLLCGPPCRIGQYLFGGGI